MSRKQQGRGDRDISATRASSGEDSDLEEFCATITCEDICFETWQKCHSQLDLLYPLRILRSQLSQTPSTVVKLSRTISAISTNGHRVEQRESFECEIDLCQNLSDKKVLKFPGLGDRRDDATGDLLIILTIAD